MASLDSEQSTIEAVAKEDPKVATYLEGKEIKKVIFVKTANEKHTSNHYGYFSFLFLLT